MDHNDLLPTNSGPTLGYSARFRAHTQRMNVSLTVLTHKSAHVAYNNY